MIFWAGKRVFITGHTGFKGSWLTLWLKNLGATVGGYSLPPPTSPSLYEILNINSLIDYEHMGDIRHSDLIKTALKKFNPDIIIHMAAQPLVRQSYLEPIETYETNVIGTLNLLNASRFQTNLKSIVIVTTDKCYENNELIWSYREHDPMGGYDPYSSSKACAEIATASFARSYFNGGSASIATARAGNVIGGGDWSKDRLIVDIINSLSANMPIVLRNPKSVRPWQHVLEPLNGYMMLAKKLYQSEKLGFEGWNFGPNNDQEVSVEAIANIALQIWGSGSIEISANDGPHEANHLTLDSTKAKKHLNWRPKLSINDSISKTVHWYKEWLSGSDMRKYTINKIQEYESM